MGERYCHHHPPKQLTPAAEMRFQAKMGEMNFLAQPGGAAHLQRTTLIPCSSSRVTVKQAGALQRVGKGKRQKTPLTVALGRGKRRAGSSQGLTFSLGAVVDLAVLLGDGVGVGRR